MAKHREHRKNRGYSRARHCTPPPPPERRPLGRPMCRLGRRGCREGVHRGCRPNAARRHARRSGPRRTGLPRAHPRRTSLALVGDFASSGSGGWSRPLGMHDRHTKGQEGGGHQSIEGNTGWSTQSGVCVAAARTGATIIRRVGSAGVGGTGRDPRPYCAQRPDCQKAHVSRPGPSPFGANRPGEGGGGVASVLARPCCAATASTAALLAYGRSVTPRDSVLCRFVAAQGGGGLGGWLCWACGGAYWPLALEPSAMTSRHPHCRGHPPASGGGGGIQNATSAHGVLP